MLKFIEYAKESFINLVGSPQHYRADLSLAPHYGFRNKTHDLFGLEVP